MNRKRSRIIVIISFLIISIQLFPKQYEDKLLKDIAEDITQYKSKTITLRLRLKYVDNIFERIIFYDKKNHDIEFNISSKKIKKLLKNDMLNLHEGMDYLVTFTVNNVGSLGKISGELKGFRPVILDSIPESLSGGK